MGWGIYDGKKKVGKKSGFGNFLAFKMSMPIKFKQKKEKKKRKRDWHTWRFHLPFFCFKYIILLKILENETQLQIKKIIIITLPSYVYMDNGIF